MNDEEPGTFHATAYYPHWAIPCRFLFAVRISRSPFPHFTVHTHSLIGSDSQLSLFNPFPQYNTGSAVHGTHRPQFKMGNYRWSAELQESEQKNCNLKYRRFVICAVISGAISAALAVAFIAIWCLYDGDGDAFVAIKARKIYSLVEWHFHLITAIQCSRARPYPVVVGGAWALNSRIIWCFRDMPIHMLPSLINSFL